MSMPTTMWFSLTVTAVLVSLVSARSLRAPAELFASLEGAAMETTGDAVNPRLARHLQEDFAVFDRPLSADTSSVAARRVARGAPGVLHHRIRSRDAGCEPEVEVESPAELVGKFVDSAPEMTCEYEAGAPEYSSKCNCHQCQQASPRRVQQRAFEFLETPGELSDDAVVLSVADDRMEGDREATICEEGLQPVDTADESCEQGRPDRRVDVEAEAQLDEVIKEVKEEAREEAVQAAVN